jgi:hypothetical protein
MGSSKGVEGVILPRFLARDVMNPSGKKILAVDGDCSGFIARLTAKG